MIAVPDGLRSLPLAAKTSAGSEPGISTVSVYSVTEFATVDRPLESPIDIPYGLAVVTSVLESEGHSVSVLVVTPETPLDEMVNRLVRERRPRLVCMTAVSTQFPAVSRIAAAFKRADPSIFVLLGGSHATLNPRDAITPPGVDAICVGEGEIAVSALATALRTGTSPRGIPNLWVKEAGTGAVEENPTLPFNLDLDKIPFISREPWRPWLPEFATEAAVLVGRGCPYQCSYCSNHALSRVSEGKYVRFRSPQNIVDEVRELTTAYPEIGHVFLEAETLSVKLDYTLEFLEHLRRFNEARAQPIDFSTNITLTKKVLNNRTLLRAFQLANFHSLFIGLETGSPRLRKVLRRPRYTNDEFIAFAHCAREFGIGLNVYAIVGLPTETRAEFEETVACLRAAQPANVCLSMFFPYPGTDLSERAVEEGFISRDYALDVRERLQPVIDLPEFSRRQITLQYLMIDLRVFWGHRDLATMLRSTGARLADVYPISRPAVKRLDNWIPTLSKLVGRARARLGIRRRLSSALARPPQGPARTHCDGSNS